MLVSRSYNTHTHLLMTKHDSLIQALTLSRAISVCPIRTTHTHTHTLSWVISLVICCFSNCICMTSSSLAICRPGSSSNRAARAARFLCSLPCGVRDTAQLAHILFYEIYIWPLSSNLLVPSVFPWSQLALPYMHWNIEIPILHHHVGHSRCVE